LGAQGDRRFNRVITDWCAGQARTLKREGRSSEAQAALTAASAAYRQLLAADDQPDPVLLLTAGRTLSDLGRHDEAAETLAKASASDPSNPFIWSNLCLALSRGGRDEQALDACGNALNLEPDNVLASTVTIRLLGRKGLWFEASDQAMNLLTRSVAELNDSREVDPLVSAAGAVVDGLKTDGDNFTAGKVAGALGRFLSDRSRHDPAIDALLQAVDLTPDNDNRWANLCLGYQRAGRATAALESCRHALEINEEHFWARVMSAEILASGEQWPEALQQARRAALSPPPSGGHTEVLIRFANHATEAGFHGQACEMLPAIENPDVEAIAGALEELDCPDTGTAGR
ncbi:MAG: tetratricopeptide repeat protein, partial [Acidobacteriota bacterium]